MIKIANHNVSVGAIIWCFTLFISNASPAATDSGTILQGGDSALITSDTAGAETPVTNTATQPMANTATLSSSGSEYALGMSKSMTGHDGVGSSGSITPDLFTGTMSYGIPIDVPAGRKGMQPELALTYRSNNGNGWVKVGWDINLGAIERSARNGINWDDNTSDFVLRMNGSAIDLVNVSGEYRAKIESSFIRIKKMAAGDGKIYWEATDRNGVRYLYGQTAASRQDNPADTNKIFKWCLDRVEDTNGNYMTLSYFKDQGQVYPNRIDYAGNVDGTAGTNYVKFYRESRTDNPIMYLIMARTSWTYFVATTSWTIAL